MFSERQNLLHHTAKDQPQFIRCSTTHTVTSQGRAARFGVEFTSRSSGTNLETGISNLYRAGEFGVCNRSVAEIRRGTSRGNANLFKQTTTILRGSAG